MGTYKGPIWFWPNPIGLGPDPTSLNQNLWIPGWLGGDTGYQVAYSTQQQNGLVLSVQSDGTYQTRPPGSDGQYEQCLPHDSFPTLIYNPAGVPYQILYKVRIA